jgi:hypothetical protein
MAGKDDEQGKMASEWEMAGKDDEQGEDGERVGDGVQR